MKQRWHTLQRLPLFEAAASTAVNTEQEGTAADPAAAASEASASANPVEAAPQPGGVFMDLLGERFTAPEDFVVPAALPPAFVAVANSGERAALALLGVRRLTLAEVYRCDFCDYFRSIDCAKTY